MTLKELQEQKMKEFEEFVEIKHKNEYGMSSTYKLVWGCEECGGEDAEQDIKNFIQQAQQEAWNSAVEACIGTLPEPIKLGEEYYAGMNDYKEVTLLSLNQLKGI